VQRRFAKGQTVAALHDWVASLSAQAAVRAFVLSQMGESTGVICFLGGALGA